MTQNVCKHSQLRLKELSRQDKPHYFLILKEKRAWMQLYRSPAVYDVIVKKKTLKMKKNHSSWMENIQIIFNMKLY